MQVLTINDDISLQLYNGPVGISFSGGADSSLLVYLAMTQLSVPIHLVITTDLERENSHEKTATEVAKKLIEITGHTDIHYHINRQVDSATGVSTLFDLCKKLLYQDGVVKSMLTGITANPPSAVLKDFDNRDAAILVRSSNVKRALKIKPGWYNPLTNLNKQDICRLYDKHGILDSVFPLTKSCSTDYGKPPCGRCWFCEEREWGLKFNS
ncbi:7-cyano-7-deazaguanine synthase [bacterium]|nr:7-cyano-7-deazaguanine synthase [bacterium]